MQCKIIRTVNGHHADPKSTRDLSQISAEELDHIRMSCEAGMLEAETYLAMDGSELAATLERNRHLIASAGMGVLEAGVFTDDEVRTYLKLRLKACGSLLRKLSKSRDRKVVGIKKCEYEHLVTSLQAAYREAEICCTFENEQIGEAFTAMNQVRVQHGLEAATPYFDHAVDYLDFFQERAELLWDMLGRVNQPHPSLNSESEFAIFA